MNDETPTVRFNDRTKGSLMRAWSCAFLAYARRYFVAGTCFSKWAGRLFVGMGLLTTLLLNGPSFAQTYLVVYVVPIEGIIDLGLAPFVQRVLGEATDAGAAAVILEINTFGGRVDAAVHIRDALLNARVKTVASVNKRAISAGAQRVVGLRPPF